jgi:chloride channel protein, CIC family
VLGLALRLRPEKVKTLVPVGAAGAIAAVFNTPLATVMFALEEIVGDLHAPVLGSVVLASATSWGYCALSSAIALYLGSAISAYEPRGVRHLCGSGGGRRPGLWLFAKLLLGMRERFLHFPRWTVWFQPVAGGLLVGLLGWFVPQVMGVGYGYVGLALNGNMTLRLMALLVLKLITVTTSYALGNAGGIFGPALFIGAMLGGSVGAAAHHFFPAYTATPGAYALVGMGAAFAGIVRAPMTSVLMIFEMTQDYAVIVPLMIANLVSLFISSRFQKQALYEALAIQDGVHLPSAASLQRQVQRKVVRVMRAANSTLSAETTVRKALELAISTKSRTQIVVDRAGVVGVINLSWLNQEEVAEGLDKKLGEVLNPLVFPHVHADQGLDLALERMGTNQIEMLPVVSRADVHKLEGIVTLHDVLDSYGVTRLSRKTTNRQDRVVLASRSQRPLMSLSLSIGLERRGRSREVEASAPARSSERSGLLGLRFTMTIEAALGGWPEPKVG